ncbi:hypothetical protein ACFV5J_14395 [Streptomyces zaomyceticus]|uniref:hypothetical protein n=1 Tax=Streptomyces zaomyceticus TaxID=68286 RepID=UPI003655BE29
MTTKPSATTRPSVSQRPYDTMPARALGRAAATGRDQAFLDAVFDSGIPSGYKAPALDQVILIHRLDDESGELAWMPDGRTFCYRMVRGTYGSSRCGRLPEKGPAPGLLFTVTGDHDRVTHEDDLDRFRVVSFVMAEGGSRTFDHVARGRGAGPVHQAVARFPSGRMVTFLTFDRPGLGELDPKAEICSSDRAVCFPSEPVPY